MESININSKTWKNTMGISGKDQHEKECLEALRTSFQYSRKNAKELAKLINRELPFFTVHDERHFDALWSCVDLLLDWGTPKKKLFPLNPAEGYVLGLTFLLHDLGMGLASYTEGIDELKNRRSFQDALADEFLKEKDHSIELSEKRETFEILNKYPHNSSLWPPYVQRAAARFIREIHAEKARQLGTQEWMCNNKSYYLLEGNELREHYGELVGMIAASHGWNYEKFQAELEENIAPPTSFPAEWEVDSHKLACILRVADAIQIDSTRAGSFPMALRHLEGESSDHWIFQNKLRAPTIEKERLCFSCKTAFSQEEMDAWWLCYDTLRKADWELRLADAFLTETGRTPFRVRAIYGISSPNELCKKIKVTDDWMPIDTSIRVGDVGRLVTILGGEQLYGKDNKWVPFRELIQNSADAIRARKNLEGDSWESGRGKITITLFEHNAKKYISFADTGIGMSEELLTGPFLDFGQSFWNTALMRKEWPGLAATGYQHTGQYGIGFYSVFMWTNSVKVVTRKYTRGREKTLVLEFRDGVKSRPILRKANTDEERLVGEGGTSVILQIDDVSLWNTIISGDIFPKSDSAQKESLTDSIAMYFPCLDCDLFLNKDGSNCQIIKADDWKMIKPIKLIERLTGPTAYEFLKKERDIDALFAPFIQNMEPIRDEDGNWLGRGFIHFLGSKFEIPFLGKLITHGCMEKNIYRFSSFISGCFIGKNTKADRFKGVPIMSNTALKKWLNNHAEKLIQKGLSPQLQLELSNLLAQYDVLRKEDLYIAKSGSTYWTYQQLINIAKDHKHAMFLIPESDIKICKSVSSAQWKKESKLIADFGYLKQLKKHGVIVLDGCAKRTEYDLVSSKENRIEVTSEYAFGSNLKKYIIEAIKVGLEITSENDCFHVFSSPENNNYILRAINNEIKRINKDYYVQNTRNSFILITREKIHI